MSNENELLNLLPDDVNLEGKVLSPAEALASAIKALETKMVEEYPSLPADMAKIRACIQSAPELKATLTPEQIGIIMKGFQAVTDISIVPKKPKKEKVAKLSLGEDEHQPAKQAATVAKKEEPAVRVPAAVSSSVMAMMLKRSKKV